jgi:sulfatase maturation enzyme AslB (radical SAM superfamily)
MDQGSGRILKYCENVAMKTQMPYKSRFQHLMSAQLPIFSAFLDDCILFYSPRLLCVLDKSEYSAVLRHVDIIKAERQLSELPHQASQTMAQQAAVRIVQSSRDAVDAMDDTSREEFSAECLTLYVNNQCNLRCRYCYSMPDLKANETPSEEGVRSAARLVAGMCAARKRPFAVAFHGGGEPAMHPKQVDRFFGIAREEAQRFKLQLQTYIATNGAVSEKTAHWLASRFDLVGVSCDGPPDIQDRNRPGRSGKALSKRVERTMSILNRHGRPFHVRVTISRETVDRQMEIVSYLADRYAPAEIRIEPAYINPSGEPPLEASQVDSFVNGLLAAKAAGAARGVSVTTSITRPDALYGRYCNVLRHVVNLIPGDVATGCFLASRPEEVAAHGLTTGLLDSPKGVFRLDMEHIRSLISRCSEKPVRCEKCLCGFQCTYGCPDHCVLEVSGGLPSQDDRPDNFRCLVNRMLMERTLCEGAQEAWGQAREGYCREIRDIHRALSVIVYRKG